jgi:hypothetical protein
MTSLSKENIVKSLFKINLPSPRSFFLILWNNVAKNPEQDTCPEEREMNIDLDNIQL